ncbi:UDP-glucose 4-epimerase family protein [Shewanella baltica]|uniref:UDP-glucose 4-epimerase family protein n=1 Tax=Shewanella baltica TaxID=62322 RepID=UPI003984B631
MIAVTGYTGFIGRHLLSALPQAQCCLLGRQPYLDYPFFKFDLENYESEFLLKILEGLDVIVHLAARVHIMNDASVAPLDDYRSINRDSTLSLATIAAKAGVKRFIYLSSIKVNGECTHSQAFTSDSPLLPEDPYGISKSEAEVGLKKLAHETGMEVVIIRPTLVYGPGVKANFSSLMNLVSKGIPLPFGSIINNKRSLVSINNLVDLIVTCIEHPKAANQVFLVSDDYDISTSQMAREMAIALDKPTWQAPVPIWCYKLAGKLFKKSDVVDRLTGSLQVDISHTKDTLGWKPPQTLQDGFKQTAQAFMQVKTK